MNPEYTNLSQLLGHPEFREGIFWHKARYGPNEAIITEGSTGRDIFVVLEGTLMVCTDVQISESRHMNSGLCELFNGEEFAHSCFFDGEPHCATVKTLTSCELAVVSAPRLRSFLDSHPDIGYRILNNWVKRLLPRLRQDNKRISTLFSWGLKAHKIDVDG